MTNLHFELLELAAELLAPLHQRVVFVGGATVSLHIDDTAVPVRSTKDVEDLVTILDGRSTIFDELRASSADAQFVHQWLMSIDSGTLLDAVAEHTNDHGRATYLLEQLT